MCLPFSQLNGHWMVAEMRLKSTFPVIIIVAIQPPFSHHSVDWKVRFHPVYFEEQIIGTKRLTGVELHICIYKFVNTHNSTKIRITLVGIFYMVHFISWSLACGCFVCMLFGLSHIETPQLPVKGCKFIPILSAHNHWALRTIEHTTPTATWETFLQSYPWGSMSFTPIGTGNVCTCLNDLCLLESWFEHSNFRMWD